MTRHVPTRMAVRLFIFASNAHTKMGATIVFEVQDSFL